LKLKWLQQLSVAVPWREFMTCVYPDPGEEQIVVVDGEDEIVGSSLRKEMREQGLLHRVTYLLVFSSQGSILVQKRTSTKDWYPSHLDFAAGGVVQFGESYELSAQRELKEELGISEPLKFEFKIYFEDITTKPTTRSWGKVFSCVSDGPFELQPEEVDSVEFVSMEEALKIALDRVTPDTRQVLLSYLL
jgi:isopentenyldiphosphate isomerase